MERARIIGFQERVPEMTECGIMALHEMKEVEGVLKEIDGMLSDVLDRKREGHLASVHVILKKLWVRAGQEKKAAAGKFAHELEEYLRLRHQGIELARVIIRSALNGAKRYGKEDSVPHTPSAMKRHSLKQASGSPVLPLAA